MRDNYFSILCFMIYRIAGSGEPVRNQSAKLSLHNIFTHRDGQRDALDYIAFVVMETYDRDQLVAEGICLSLTLGAKSILAISGTSFASRLSLSARKYAYAIYLSKKNSRRTALTGFSRKMWIVPDWWMSYAVNMVIV